MKKFHKKLSSLLLGTAFALTTVVTPALAADSSVTYEGRAEKFVYVPGSEYSDTDLFDNFKNVMPGDSLEQTIYVANNYKGSDYVKIYLRAEAHDEVENPLSEKVAEEKESVASMEDFLSQLSMKVYLGEKVIYEASPDELDGLAENVLIGAFAYGAGAELKVTLDVPIELGNEYMYREGEVDWVFTVEERNYPNDDDDDRKPKPEKDPKPDQDPERDIIIIEPEDVPLGDLPTEVLDALDIPKTGDETMILPYILLLCIGIFGLAATVLNKRDKRTEKQ